MNDGTADPQEIDATSQPGAPGHPGESAPDEKLTAAQAELEQLIETIGPERAQEMMELLLTELITEQDPEAQD